MDASYAPPLAAVTCQERQEAVVLRYFTFVTLGYGLLIGLVTAVSRLWTLQRDKKVLQDLCKTARSRVELKRNLSLNFHSTYESEWWDSRSFYTELSTANILLKRAADLLDETGKGLGLGVGENITSDQLAYDLSRKDVKVVFAPSPRFDWSLLNPTWWGPILLGQEGQLGNLKRKLELATKETDAAVRVLDHLHQSYLRELVKKIYEKALQTEIDGLTPDSYQTEATTPAPQSSISRSSQQPEVGLRRNRKKSRR